MSTPADVKKKLDLIIPKQGKQTITPFIHGVPGIGKSAIVKQIAEERNIQFIDLRLSQHEASDIKGIPFPVPEESICRWLPPEFLPFKNTKKYKGTQGILFLDELNRAAPDVLQTVFQLVLDRQVGNLELVDEWHIVCAGNLGDDDECDVVNFDPALNNRFIHFYMEPHLDSWLDWAEKNDINQEIINFIKVKPAYLYRKCKNKSEQTLLITPRSWEKFSDIIEQNINLGIKEVTALLASDIISDAAIHFIKFLEERTVEPKDVINRYSEPEVKNRVQSLSREQKYALNQELVSYIGGIKKIEKRHLDNVHGYAIGELEDDIHIAFVRDISKKTTGPNNNGFIDKYLDTFDDESTLIIETLGSDDKESKK